MVYRHCGDVTTGYNTMPPSHTQTLICQAIRVRMGRHDEKRRKEDEDSGAEVTYFGSMRWISRYLETVDIYSVSVSKTWIIHGKCPWDGCTSLKT